MTIPNPEQPLQPYRRPRVLWSWSRDLLLALGLSAFFIIFLYQPVRVEGTSMLPGLQDQERIFINKFVYKLEPIERGDIVVFHYPFDPSKSYIKRVIGLSGDRVRITGVLYTARDAAWGFPEIKLGCYPPVAAVALPAVVGQKRAEELILTGRQITGDEAVAIGLANKSAVAEELNLLVDDTLRELRNLSPAALALAKKAVYAWDAIHFDKGLARAEKIYLEDLMRTPDAQEGISAFIEKRRPTYHGR